MQETKIIQLVLLLLMTTSLLCGWSQVLTIPEAQAEEYLTLTPGHTENPDPTGLGGGTRQYILDDPKLSDIPLLLSYAIKFMLSLAGLGAVFFIFAGAFQYISGATIEQKQKGKTQIMYAVIGIVVVTLSYAIVETLTQVLF